MSILTGWRGGYRYIVALVLLIVASSMISYINLSNKTFSVTDWSFSTLLITLGPINLWMITFSSFFADREFEATSILVAAIYLIATTFPPVFLMWRQLTKGGYLYLIFASVIWLFEGWFFTIAVWI
jgi:hypothetical protein